MFNTGTDVLSVSLSKWLYIAPRGILHLVIAMCFRSHMAALGFYSTATEGCFTNGEIEVWDVVPRNVLKDSDGDIFVIDAELRLL